MLFIVKYVVERILRDNQWNRIGVEDPYFIEVDVQKRGKTVKKTVARPIPEGITENDAKVYLEFRTSAKRYDQWFSIGHAKFGWLSVINFIPVVGPILTACMLLRLLWITRRLSDPFPLDLQLMFLMNMAIDFGLGLIPVVGSLIVVGYKANSRNFGLLERHLTRIGERNRGLISPDEVRPGFINDRVQPFVEKDVYPGVIKAGGKVKEVVGELIIPGVKRVVESTLQKKNGKTEVEIEEVDSKAS